ncbi:MAG: ankyrin repeat domain-containing protein, partial [Crocosphaera sp.]
VRQEENLEVVKLLINQGASVNVADEEGKSPLHYAVRTETKIAKVLIDNQANINALDEDSKTPLVRATDVGNLEGVELLIKKGANAQDNMALKSVLSSIEKILKNIQNGGDFHLEYKRKRYDLATLVIAETNINQEQASELLSKLAETKNAKLIELLLDKGADINILNKFKKDEEIKLIIEKRKRILKD